MGRSAPAGWICSQRNPGDRRSTISKSRNSGVWLFLLDFPVTSRVMKAKSTSQGPSPAIACSAVTKERSPDGTAAAMRDPQVRYAKSESSSLNGGLFMFTNDAAPERVRPYQAIAEPLVSGEDREWTVS